MHAVYRDCVYSLSFHITAPYKSRQKGSFLIIFLYQMYQMTFFSSIFLLLFLQIYSGEDEF